MGREILGVRNKKHGKDSLTISQGFLFSGPTT